MKLSYIKRLLKTFKFKALWETTNKVKKETKKNRIMILFDIIYCTFKYGAGHHDYYQFGFYNMKHENRDTYVTRIRNKKMIMQLNDQKYSVVIDRKQIFNIIFNKYLKRDWINVSVAKYDEFNKFVERHKTIFAKPVDGDSGKGIQKIDVNSYKNTKELYNYLIDNKLFMVEELIKQHEDMSKIYSNAINCMRIVTLVKADRTVDVVYAVLKTGSGGSCLDNMGFGGICAPINIETGTVYGIGHKEDGTTYEKHPDTGIPYNGFKIPYFNEALEMVKEAALEVHEIRFIGWDVYIGQDGPGIVEGNDYPDYGFWQLKEHTQNKIGLMPYYKKVLPELKFK